MKKRFRVGTRGSKLALVQSGQALDALRALHPGVEFDIVVIKTTGDKITDVPLAKIGDKGLFVKEIEQALLSGNIDIGIHSMKDMPSQLPDGLRIGCVPARKPPFDGLILKQGRTLDDLPTHALVGTGSLRRRSQLAAARPDLRFEDMRGNLPTRLRKLQEGDMSATLLAVAGLARLGAVSGEIEEGGTVELEEGGGPMWVVPVAICVPAVGQGALCIESRGGDADADALLGPFEDADSRICVEAERGFMRTLEGGCQIPAGALARRVGDRIEMDAVVCSLDGTTVYREHFSGPASDPAAVGQRAADELMNRGARAVVEAIRQV